jgi:hypothetical protein
MLHAIVSFLLILCVCLLDCLSLSTGEASAMEASQELEAFLGQINSSSSSSAAGANYMLIIAEDNQQQQGLAAAADGQTTAAAAGGSGLLGVLAVDVGSGDIAYGLCSSMLGSSSSSSSSNVVPLEAVLLSLSPAELVVCEPVSAATNRQLAAYMAGVAGRRCRLERLQQQQQQQQQSEAGSSREAAAAAATQGGSSSSSSYLSAATLHTLSEFYSSSSSSQSGSAGQTGQAGHAAAAGSSIDPSSNNNTTSSSSSDDLRFILSLPPLVLVALAGAVRHLTCYGLTGVLHCTSGFRSLGAAGFNMMLDGNALRQLEVLAAGGCLEQRFVVKLWFAVSCARCTALQCSMQGIVLSCVDPACTRARASYGLTGVLRCTSSFRSLGAVGANMTLDHQCAAAARGASGRCGVELCSHCCTLVQLLQVYLHHAIRPTAL